MQRVFLYRSGAPGVTRKLLALCLLLWPSPLWAGELPGAAGSLMLDVTRAGQRLLVAGEYGQLFFSDDQGKSWERSGLPSRVTLTALHFPSAGRGWAVGHDGMVFASIDGGENWSLQRDGLREQGVLNRETLGRLQMRREAVREQLLASEQGAARAELRLQLEDLVLDIEDMEATLAEPVHAPPLLDVYFLDELRGFAVGAFNTLLQTTDGGLHWLPESERLDNPDSLHLNAIVGDGEASLWIVGEGGLVFRSRDAGASWQRLQSPYDGSFFGVLHNPHDASLVVFGLRGNVFRSADGGRSWDAVAVPVQRTLNGGHVVNADYQLLAGAVGTLLVSRDGGRSFREHPLPRREAIAAMTSSEDRVFLVGRAGLQVARPFGEQP